MRTFFRVAPTILALCALGCGAVQSTDFPNRLIGANGQELVLDDIEEIANDPGLSADEKRQALRDLGIEDEELIDALLEL